ncbi:MAG: hypothetical protein HFF84_08210 [Oscillibacter sp.]|nr:hypothetical protein [Oscillibacter sp.]
MAERPAFFHREKKVVSNLYTFEWFPGFAVSQKQKSIESLHAAIRETDADARPLEVSTKSKEPFGVRLSAFNLMLHHTALENVFQSAKVFENGGPYLDLLEVPPKEAKKDQRLKNSGRLTAFYYQGEPFPLLPQTAFYDYLYVAAVRESLAAEDLQAILGYNYFTDIVFHPAKSINTQARTAALIKLMMEDFGCLPDFSKEAFLQYHKEHVVYGNVVK